MLKDLYALLSAIAPLTSALAALLSVIAIAVAAYFGPYLKKKAEARAKNEDFELYLEHLLDETQAVEAVKSAMSSEAGHKLETHKAGLALDASSRVENLKAKVAESIERIKLEAQADLSITAQVFVPRLGAYRALWELTQSLRFFGGGPLSDEARQEVAWAMTDWYYKGGNGIFLSQKAMDSWLEARRQLEAESSTDLQVRDAFSALRAQLKNDLRVYGRALRPDAHKDVDA